MTSPPRNDVYPRPGAGACAITRQSTFGHPGAGDTVMLDCVIIGGGPAGLTAAIHMARFRRRVIVIDAGASRAALIPRTWNHPGYPAGIRGGRLLGRMRQQVSDLGVPIVRERVVRVAPLPHGGFEVLAGSLHIARHVILATGAVDRLPPIPDARAAILAGQLRLCPVCDAYEATDKPVAVIGADAHAASEALFLSHYTRQVTLLTLGAPLRLSPDDHGSLTNAGVTVDTSPDVTWDLSGPGVTLIRPNAAPLRVEAVWSGLGAVAQAGLATRLGVIPAPDGRIDTDDHQQTTVLGLFAAGDLTIGLNQIGTAIGQAQIAASRIHSILRTAEGRALDHRAAQVLEGGGQ